MRANTKLGYVVRYATPTGWAVAEYRGINGLASDRFHYLHNRRYVKTFTAAFDIYLQWVNRAGWVR